MHDNIREFIYILEELIASFDVYLCCPQPSAHQSYFIDISLFIFRNIRYVRAALLLLWNILVGFTEIGTFQSCSCFISFGTAWVPESLNILSTYCMEICVVWPNISPSVQLFWLWLMRKTYRPAVSNFTLEKALNLVIMVPKKCPVDHPCWVWSSLLRSILGILLLVLLL